MIEPLLGLPAHVRERLACALETGALRGGPSATALSATLGIRGDAGALASCLRELEQRGLSGGAAAFWVRSVSAAAQVVAGPSLVWSGPEVAGVHARETRRTFAELVGAAERTAWISAYAYFDGPRAFDVIARRMDACPGLRVMLLLNIQRRRGDARFADDLVRRFADRFWKSDWPGRSRPAVFFDPRALEPDEPAGVLHAKATVVDDESVLVTSANLTEAALDRNIELGVLVRDRALAMRVVAHFQGLIDGEILRALPGE